MCIPAQNTSQEVHWMHRAGHAMIFQRLEMDAPITVQDRCKRRRQQNALAQNSPAQTAPGLPLLP